MAKPARGNDGGRLREILSVLRKHAAAKGVGPQKLREIIVDLGPTFIKLGQILSMRPDLLPAAYCRELARLRVSAAPMRFDEVRRVIETEYGAPLPRVFSSIDEAPIGSASIAQVHAAVLRDGRRVAVKVQRPGIREVMARDIALLHRAARLLNLTEMRDMVDFHKVLDELWAVTQQEMDFLMEAKNAAEFRDLNRSVVYAYCPEMIQAHTTPKVLMMEYTGGIAIDDSAALLAEGYDLDEIGIKLADHYVKQIIDDGFFHADPHPGNIRIHEGKIVWLDFGMMGRLSGRDRGLLRDGVKAMVRGDILQLDSIVVSMCVCKGPVDHGLLREDIRIFLNKYKKMGMGSVNFGRICEEIMDLAKKHRLALPDGVVMLGRGMVNLQGVLSAVSPEIDLIQIMENHMLSSLMKDFNWKQTLKSAAHWLYDSGRKTARIPALMSDMLELGVSGQARLNIKWVDAEKPLATIDRMVNRMIRCVFSAALLIGSCMICGTDMRPKLFNIPVLGLAGFAAALIIGLRVLWEMRNARKK